jgi:hypothetical protein
MPSTASRERWRTEQCVELHQLSHAVSGAKRKINRGERIQSDWIAFLSNDCTAGGESRLTRLFSFGTNWAKTSLTRLTGVASRVRRVPGQAASPPSEAQKSCFDIMIRRSGIYFIVTEASDADEQKHEQRRSDDTIGGIRSYHGRYRIPTRLASQNCDHLRNLFRGRGRISEFP